LHWPCANSNPAQRLNTKHVDVFLRHPRRPKRVSTGGPRAILPSGVLNRNQFSSEQGFERGLVIPGHFSTLCIPPLPWRFFCDNGQATEKVVLVNGALSPKFFDDPNPVGHHVLPSKQSGTISGRFKMLSSCGPRLGQ
jgi:hypothetical protein